MHQLLPPSDRGAEERCSLHLLLTSREGHTGDMRLKGSSDSEVVDFGGPGRRWESKKSKFTTLYMRTADFGLSKG